MDYIIEILKEFYLAVIGAMDFIIEVLKESYLVAKEAGVYLFFGFVIAGFLKAFLKTDIVKKSLGKNKISSVIKSALLGIPLPLCSCSVIPVAQSLKKEGASNGAISSFLISTPETGVDSISITYALMNPIFTIARPVAAFFNAVFAGLFQILFDRKGSFKPKLEKASTCDSNGSCQCSTESSPKSSQSDIKSESRTISQYWQKLREGMSYSFLDLLPDIGKYLAYGILLTGFLTFVIPINSLEESNNYPILSMLIMLVFSIPLYICSTASTPIAASLILKGLNPGAALVFLMAGPATNMVTISAVLKIMGKKGLVIYLLSIVMTSLLAGILLDYLYNLLSIAPLTEKAKNSEITPDWIKEIFGILLSIYLIYILVRGKLRWIIKKYTTRKNVSP